MIAYLQILFDHTKANLGPTTGWVRGEQEAGNSQSLLQLGVRSSLLEDYRGLMEPTLSSFDSNAGILELGEEEGNVTVPISITSNPAKTLYPTLIIFKPLP